MRAQIRSNGKPVRSCSNNRYVDRFLVHDLQPLSKKGAVPASISDSGVPPRAHPPQEVSLRRHGRDTFIKSQNTSCTDAFSARSVQHFLIASFCTIWYLDASSIYLAISRRTERPLETK